MTDYVISSNLQQAYDAGRAAQSQTDNSAGAPNQPAPDDAASAPPAITPEMKAEIAAQVKLELEEQQQQAAAAQAASQAAGNLPEVTPDDDTPDALKPGHTLFRVVAPLSV